MTHADRFGAVIPQTLVHRVPGCDHQLHDLTEVARVVSGGAASASALGGVRGPSPP